MFPIICNTFALNLLLIISVLSSASSAFAFRNFVSAFCLSFAFNSTWITKLSYEH